MRQIDGSVVSRHTLCQAVWQVQVSLPEEMRDFHPGQLLLAAGPAYLRRPVWPCRLGETDFDFLTAPGSSTFDAWLTSLAPGDSLHLLGPIGNGFPMPQKRERWLFIAETAVAVGPLLPLLNRAVLANADILLLTGASFAARLFPSNQLPLAVELQVATLDGSKGIRGRVIDLVPSFLSWSDHVVAVGSRSLYRALQMATESTPGIGSETWVLLWDASFVCGVGVCHTCAVTGASGETLACREGPVFRLADLSLESYGAETGLSCD